MLNLVHGWTADITYVLKEEENPVNLTGLTVAMLAYDKNGVALTMAGSFAVLSAADGTVRFSPGAGDIDAADQPIGVRFKVSDGAKHTFFPNGDPEYWFISAY